MSKRKVKNGWLEEPLSSLPSPLGEGAFDPGSSPVHSGRSNGAGDDGPAAPPADSPSPPAAAPEPAAAESAPPPPPGEDLRPDPPAAPVSEATPDPAAEPPVAQAAPPDADVPPLERRVRRLEEAIAELQAARSFGPPPKERFTDRRPPEAPPAPAPPVAGARSGLLEKVRKVIVRADPPAAPPGAAAVAALVPAAAHRKGLLLDAVAELRAMSRMFVDPRYRMSKLGWLAALGLLVALLFSYWWVPGTSLPLFGYWLNKAVDLALAYALFKVLFYQARRYRETAPDLPPSLRL